VEDAFFFSVAAVLRNALVSCFSGSSSVFFGVITSSASSTALEP
jgi:hypothetical protein